MSEPTWADGYQAVLTDDEISKAGVVGDCTNKWGELLRPVLISKGIPEKCLGIGSPCKRIYNRSKGFTTFIFPK